MAQAASDTRARALSVVWREAHMYLARQAEGASAERTNQHQSACLQMCASRIRTPQNSHLTIYTSRPRESIYRGTYRNLNHDPKNVYCTKTLETCKTNCMRARVPTQQLARNTVSAFHIS